MGKWREDWDAAWKHVLEYHQRELLDFLFPEIHDWIDWDAGYETLNTELLALRQEDAKRRRHVDRLIRAYQKGSGKPLLVHMEAQNYRENDFARRMYCYYIRLQERYEEPVCIAIILTDSSSDWKPNQWSEQIAGTHIALSFPVVKLNDYSEEFLLSTTNRNHPAAFLLLAFRKARETRHGRHRFDRRFAFKCELAEGLLSGPWSPQQMNMLFRSLEWILTLPREKELQFRKWFHSLTTQHTIMKTYTLETLAHEEGTIHGQAVALRRLLARKFGRGVIQLPWVKEKLASATQKDLEQWLEQILDARDPEEVFICKRRG